MTEEDARRAYAVVAVSHMNPIPRLIGVYPDVESAAQAQAESLADDTYAHICKTTIDLNAWE